MKKKNVQIHRFIAEKSERSNFGTLGMNKLNLPMNNYEFMYFCYIKIC